MTLVFYNSIIQKEKKKTLKKVQVSHGSFLSFPSDDDAAK